MSMRFLMYSFFNKCSINIFYGNFDKTQNNMLSQFFFIMSFIPFSLPKIWTFFSLIILLLELILWIVILGIDFSYVHFNRKKMEYGYVISVHRNMENRYMKDKFYSAVKYFCVKMILLHIVQNNSNPILVNLFSFTKYCL